MKTLSFRRPLAALLLVGSFSVFTCGHSLAFGGGVAAGGAGNGGVGTAGVGVTGGGGHGGGAVSSGGGRVGAGASSLGGGQSASGFSGGMRSGGAVGLGQHVSAGFSRSHVGGLVPTGFPSAQGPGVSSANGTFGRGSSDGGRPATIGIVQSASRGFGGAQAIGNRPAASAFNPSRVHNAWTEPNNPHVTPAARPSRYGYNGAYDQDRSVLQNQVSAGQHLNPSASNYNALTTSGIHASQGLSARGTYARGNHPNYGNYNRRTRDAYNQFFLTSALYPYLYGSFFPAYYGYYGNGYLGGGFGDYLGTDDGSLNANYGSPNFNGATGPYVPTDGSQYDNTPADSAPQSTPPTDDQNLPPNQPSSVGPQNPPTSEDRESDASGPDTLVESVQNELAKRGYYGGKVDSMYNPATQTALRRFQSDQHLAVTGRINEATLHALQLD